MIPFFRNWAQHFQKWRKHGALAVRATLNLPPDSEPVEDEPHDTNPTSWNQVFCSEMIIYFIAVSLVDRPIAFRPPAASEDAQNAILCEWCTLNMPNPIPFLDFLPSL